MPKTPVKNAAKTLFGTITDLKLAPNKRFGFIRPDDGGADIFFHETALAEGLDFDQQLIERRVLVVDCKISQRGRRATQVRPQD